MLLAEIAESAVYDRTDRGRGVELYQPGRAERRKGITESDYQGKEAAGNRREAKDASEHQCAEQQYFQV